MGRKSVTKKRNTNPQKREKYIKLLMPIFQMHGLNKYTMDDIAFELGISKATLYHYFSSKDEIIEDIVKQVLLGIKEFEPIVMNEEMDFVDRYFMSLKVLFQHTEGISNIFLKDLKDGYPQLWSMIDQFVDFCLQILKRFYELGKKHGRINTIHTAVLMASDRMLFNVLLNPEFLSANNLTLSEAFEEFFKLKCFGMLQNPDREEMDRIFRVIDYKV